MTDRPPRRNGQGNGPPQAGRRAASAATRRPQEKRPARNAAKAGGAGFSSFARLRFSRLRQAWAATGAERRRTFLLAGGILFFFVILSIVMGGERRPRYTVLPSVTDGAPAADDPGDVAGYRRDCVEGILRANAAIPPSCRSLEAIRASYRVDALDLLAQEHGRMIITARRITRGDILDDRALAACVGAGDCVAVPLPPPRERALPTEALPPASRRARADFWRLERGDPLGAEICAYMTICRALYKSRLLSFEPQAEE